MHFLNTARNFSPDYKDWLIWLRSFPIDMQFDNIHLVKMVLLICNNIFVSLDSVYLNISCFLSLFNVKYFLSS